MDIQESMDAIFRGEEALGEHFYPVFMARYPEVQRFFQGVDMRRQGIVLTVALQFIVQHHTHGFPLVKAYLRTLGMQHEERGVTADLYPKWRDAMLETLASFHGASWDEALERQWREAIDGASAVMLGAYAGSPQRL